MHNPEHNPNCECQLPTPENDRYCKPWNAGLASSPSAVNRRLAKLLDALADQINPDIVEGDINDDIWNFRCSLIKRLEADGYKITVPKDRFRVTR